MGLYAGAGAYRLAAAAGDKQRRRDDADVALRGGGVTGFRPVFAISCHCPEGDAPYSTMPGRTQSKCASGCRQQLRAISNVGEMTLMSHFAEAENPQGIVEPMRRI
jgi:hypothetical protein